MSFLDIGWVSCFWKLKSVERMENRVIVFRSQSWWKEGPFIDPNEWFFSISGSLLLKDIRIRQDSKRVSKENSNPFKSELSDLPILIENSQLHLSSSSTISQICGRFRLRSTYLQRFLTGIVWLSISCLFILS